MDLINMMKTQSELTSSYVDTDLSNKTPEYPTELPGDVTDIHRESPDVTSELIPTLPEEYSYPTQQGAPQYMSEVIKPASQLQDSLQTKSTPADKAMDAYNMMYQKSNTPQEVYSIKNQISDSQNTLNQMNPVAELSYSEFTEPSNIPLTTRILNFFNEIGNKVTREGFGEVILDRRSINNSMKYGRETEKITTFRAVPDVIKNGELINHDANWKNRGYETFTFAAPVNIVDLNNNSTRYDMAVVVRKPDNENRYYLHRVVESNNMTQPVALDTMGSLESHSNTQAVSDNNLPQTPESVNTQENIREMGFEMDMSKFFDNIVGSVQIISNRFYTTKDINRVIIRLADYQFLKTSLGKR